MYMHEVPVPVHNYTHLAPKLIFVMKSCLLSYIEACDLFQCGHTPLHSACYGGHPQVVQMLVDGGADINAQTKVFLNINHLYSMLSSN